MAKWFDPSAALAELGEGAGGRAKRANRANREGRFSTISTISTGGAPSPDILDAWEERSAIREFDGGQDRETAERAAAAELGANVVDLREAAARLRSAASSCGAE